jgi:membrane protein
MASHVALSLMIAVFPFLIFTTSMAGFFSNESTTKGIIELVFDYWPDEIAEPLIREMDVVLNHGSAGFLVLGIVLALFFAANGIEAVRSALNRAYQDSDPRALLKQRAQSLVFVLVGAILIFAISVLLIFAPLYFSFVEVAPTNISSRFFQSESVRFATAFGLLIFAVFSCHYWLPGHRRPVSAIWPGIALTLVLWIVSGKLFSLYLKTFATYSKTYAGLAGIMTALIFLYLMAMILIFGAEYNSAREKLRSDQARSVSDPT